MILFAAVDLFFPSTDEVVGILFVEADFSKAFLLLVEERLLLPLGVE